MILKCNNFWELFFVTRYFYNWIIPLLFFKRASRKITLVAGNDWVTGFGAKKATGVNPAGISANAVAWIPEAAWAPPAVEKNEPPPTRKIYRNL